MPLFSIGVTTYRRPEFLKECLRSILDQSEGDFEVLVGNDYPAEPISEESVGVTDPRIRIINRPANLGQISNMNDLLRQAKGQYFTWLADDDLYASEFLAQVKQAIENGHQPQCIFTAYSMGSNRDFLVPKLERSTEYLSGREFLRRYLTEKIHVLGCYGVWNRQELLRLGGMQQLGVGFSPYSDNLLAVRAGLAKQVAYVGSPLLLFRTHPGSQSWSSQDLSAYTSAQQDLCREVLLVFRESSLRQDFESNLYEVLRQWCISHFYFVLRRGSSFKGRTWLQYWKFITQYIQKADGYRFRLYFAVLKGGVRTLFSIAIRKWHKTGNVEALS